MCDERRPDDPWQRHEASQRKRRLLLSHRERLQWLEQAKAFARRALGAARTRPSDPSR